MPLDNPASKGTVADWEEIYLIPDHKTKLIDCLRLLQQTDIEYEKYSPQDLKRKMGYPSTSDVNAPGLRVWRHTVANKEMTAFFFLRAKNANVSFSPAYVLTVGVTRNDFDIFGALLPLCRYMLGEEPRRLEILSPSDPPRNPILAAVVRTVEADSNIFRKDTIGPGKPWKEDSTIWTRWRLGRNLPT